MTDRERYDYVEYLHEKGCLSRAVFIAVFVLGIMVFFFIKYLL